MSNQQFDGNFYIGRLYDLQADQLTQKPVLYDPDDLTTHGVVVGMTGSGKTGLCIDILEEAALNGIPALLIDPKGDIGNLLLHFPSLSPEDFQPWIDPDEARRDGKSIAEAAAQTAEIWRDGLEKWDIQPERIQRVKDAVEYAVYTPGSDAGLPISIVSTLAAPPLSWEQERELLREKISSTVTALLSLVGIDADPMRSREHILLANIFEEAWKNKRDLTLTELILQVQNPPLEKLGAFEVEQFFPDDDRMALAMQLNSLLASPAFQAWMEGEPLDPERLLWTPEGEPRQTVFYLAHLSDRERMFFVTLLLSAVESWMRTQPGSPSLRALIYFDEVLGFLPPVKEPPSKAPLMRMFKQARAFGVGMLLATQNPVDLDYKALSNAGTWFVGRLQTEQDKARLLDGLESATAGKGGFDRSTADKTISTLGKRVFLLHNVHEKAPQIFHTRWAMAYLKGPITRTQLRELNQLVNAGPVSERGDGRAGSVPTLPAEEDVTAGVKESLVGSQTKPAVPGGVGEYFLPNNQTAAAALKEAGRQGDDLQPVGILYRPVLVAQAQVRFSKYHLDSMHTYTAFVEEPDPRAGLDWDEYMVDAIEVGDLDHAPAPQARFSALEAPLSDSRALKALDDDFIEYLYHKAELRVPYNPGLDLVADPDMGKAEFRIACSTAARKARDDEIDKIKERYLKKMKAIQVKLEKEQRELSEDEAEFNARKMEEMATHFENVLGLFGGSRSSRRVSSSLTKRRLTAKAKADIAESQDAIEGFKAELMELEGEMAEEIDEIEDRWEEIAATIEDKVFTTYKKDIRLELFGVGWLPYWQLSGEGQSLELPGYKA